MRGDTCKIHAVCSFKHFSDRAPYTSSKEETYAMKLGKMRAEKMTVSEINEEVKISGRSVCIVTSARTHFRYYHVFFLFVLSTSQYFDVVR